MATRCPVCNGSAIIVMTGRHYYEQCTRCLATSETKLSRNERRRVIEINNHKSKIVSEKNDLYKVIKEYISKEEYYSRGAY